MPLPAVPLYVLSNISLCPFAVPNPADMYEISPINVDPSSTCNLYEGAPVPIPTLPEL